MKKFRKALHLLAVSSVLLCANAHAAIESIISSRAGILNVPILQTTSIIAQDQWYPFPVGWNTIFRVNNATSSVVLRYDDSQRAYAGNKRWTLDIIYSIINYDATGTTTTTSGETLHIDYDPQDGINYIDRDMRQYANSHKAQVKITSVSYNEWNISTSTQTVTNAHSLPAFLKDVYLDVQIDVERFYNITTASTPVLTVALNYDHLPYNELDVNWNYIQGAESYDLEWLFIDAGADPYPFTNSYNYDWGNATRINVPNQHYTLSMAFPKGILLFRMRGVGIDWDNYVNNGGLITRGETPWTSPAPTGNTMSFSGTTFDMEFGMLPEYNWAYSAGFAEDGKHMEGAQFYDGMMRGRESVAKINSDGNVIVAETAFDYEGRPAVSFLPYSQTSTGIMHYPGNDNYDRSLFDQDANIASPEAMDNMYGSGHFYSTANSTSGTTAQTPDAEGYPYARVTYVNDGTNRTETAAAAGINLKEGSGKETQYFYGTPSQSQLDRLFGNEVGYASHYKKNFTVDPNGVISVSYIDQHGRVIATALAGNAPANLQDIDNPNGNANTPVAMVDNMLVNNGPTPANDGKEAEYTITVTETSTYSFSYSVGSTCYNDVCFTTCEDCLYDLTITVVNTRTNMDALTFTPLTGISNGTYTFSASLNPGTYRVIKTLTLNQASIDQVRQDYISSQLDPQNLTPCVERVIPIPVLCPSDCHSACINQYRQGTEVPYTYVNDYGTTITETEGLDLIATCESQMCDQPPTPDPCEVKYAAMVDAVSPGGQYFDNLPSHFTIDPITGLQTINPDYYSTGTGLSYVSGDINNWLDGNNIYLSTFNSTYSTSYATWEDVRAGWNTSYETFFFQRHPEYCSYKYFCEWGCGSYLPSDGFDYEQATMHNTTGDYTTGDGEYWNPLVMSLDITQDDGDPSNAKNLYQPYAATGGYPDPRMLCTGSQIICISPALTTKTALENYLNNFFPALLADNVTTVYYSLWYVANDPDDIAGTLPVTLSTTTLDVFTALHGSGGLISNTPTAGQITPYQFFRAAYWQYRTLVIEQGFLTLNGSCSHVAGPLHDDEGYLIASTDNPTVTPQGYTILYPRSMLIDIYGDGCAAPSVSTLANTINDMVDAGATNPDNINIAGPDNAACSCRMLTDFITSRGYDAAVALNDFTGVTTTLNTEYGTSLTTTQVSDWHIECGTTDPSMGDLGVDFPEELTCDLGIAVDDIYTANLTNCNQENNDLAVYNADYLYQQNLQAATNAYMAAYTAHCISTVTETFTVGYLLHEYYYTLYYYDQAGNLVKTVPPEGVNVLKLGGTGGDVLGDATTGGSNTVDDSTDIRLYRDDIYANGYGNTTHTFCPAVHDMRSVYAYNSLQQPILAQQNEQGDTSPGDVWESGVTEFWYDYLGRLVVSQNSKQKALSPKAYSYTIYDELGRISEVGEIHTTSALLATDAGSRNHNSDYYFYTIDHVATPTALDDWLNGVGATFMSKNDVTKTYYDEIWSGINGAVTTAIGSAGQENLRNRVATVVYDDDPDPTHLTNLYADAGTASSSGFMSAFHYSYDVHGNVKAVVQETPLLQTHNQDLKQTTYEYDLISGNVNAVYYQAGQRDEFDHKYEYDADNRLHMSYSSRDGKTWEKESKQFYYSTGGMARLEIGDKTVQGEDYVYTINGWMKGMNRNTIGSYGEHMDRDIGQDGERASGNLNSNVGADAAGFTLDYFMGDYSAVNSTTAFEATKATKAYGNALAEQYNGNIAGMVTSMLDNNQTFTEVQGRAFTYDQLYRIKQSMAFHMDATAMTNNAWQASYTQDNRYRENFSYDW
ncbi:MAG: hypothetical protein ABIQ40_00600, partial [Bacteroidia bacterium]